jgi:hypothetical protein
MSHLPSRAQLGKTAPRAYPDAMDKKEIESPKLTARFLIWITGFMIVLFALIAHFVWRVF